MTNAKNLMQDLEQRKNQLLAQIQNPLEKQLDEVEDEIIRVKQEAKAKAEREREAKLPPLYANALAKMRNFAQKTQELEKALNELAEAENEVRKMGGSVTVAGIVPLGGLAQNVPAAMAFWRQYHPDLLK